MSDPQSFRSLALQGSQYNASHFQIMQLLAKVRTATIVQVLAVTNSGDVSPVGTVDVQPLVQQVDGVGTVTDMPPVYGVPYLRVQGGTNAVILDPQVGDLGIALFADRDVSAVASTKAKAPPGSARKHHLSDAMYLGGLLNGTPAQYVQFQTSGITVHSPNFVTIKAPNIKLDGIVEITGATTADSTVHVKGAQTNDSTIVASGDVTGSGTSLHTHEHSGVTTGGGTSRLLS